MERNLAALTTTEFDLIIIGGGIYGTVAAWDASLRGLKVALIEKSDFGGFTSSNSLKIIHGGLRYIQQGDVKRMRESIRERRILMKIAPHLVHPMPCIMPLYGHFGKGPEALRIALLINDIVGFDRNRLDDPQKRLPAGKILSRAECQRLVPGAREQNLTGGALWYDCQVYNSERLMISFLHSAAANGAKFANYVAAKGLVIRDGRVVGVKAQDTVSGDPLELWGRMVLNMSGAWANEVMQWLHPQPKPPRVKWSRAYNIITRKLVNDYAVGITGKHTVMEDGKLVAKGSKVFFIAPWRNYSLVGTIHDVYNDVPSAFAIRETEVVNFMQEINDAYPGAQLKRQDIRFFYGGILPMTRPDAKTGEVVLVKHYHLFDHQKADGIDGMVSVVGVKYTTARDVSVKAVDLVVKRLGKSNHGTQTESVPVFGGAIDRINDFLNQTIIAHKDSLPEPVIRQLVYNYGSVYPRILNYGEIEPNLLQPLANSAVLPAEIIYAAREEMVVHLADVVWRRTELGSGGNPGEPVLRAVADLLAKELGWSEQREREEIEQTQRIYQPKKG